MVYDENGETVSSNFWSGHTYIYDGDLTVYAQWEKLQIVGDVNADGACTVADVVLLQKWLMGAGTLTNWQAAELTGDGVIDSADLCILRRLLTNQ